MNQSILPSGRLLLLIVGLATSAFTHAQTSGDPTKPPPAWLALQPKAPGAAAVEVEAGTPGAQIVVVGPTRKFAMVDGHAVRTGETYKGSKLLVIGSDGLIWQTEGRRELTSMSPSVQKTDPAARHSKQPGAKPGQKH
jgi:hypothetical protein